LRGEKIIYEDIEEFLRSRTISDTIDSITIKVDPKRKQDRKKIQRVYFRADQNPDNSYYQLLGYDDGSLMSLNKKIKNLINEYKNWYHPIFKIQGLISVSSFFVGISLSIILYKILALLNLFQDYAGWISFFAFLIFHYITKKCLDFLFPFLDMQINITRRQNLWRVLFGTIAIGLIINSLWYIIPLLINIINTPTK
jgi:hypothetical protein